MRFFFSWVISWIIVGLYPAQLDKYRLRLHEMPVTMEMIELVSWDLTTKDSAAFKQILDRVKSDLILEAMGDLGSIVMFIERVRL